MGDGNPLLLPGIKPRSFQSIASPPFSSMQTLLCAAFEKCQLAAEHLLHRGHAGNSTRHPAGDSSSRSLSLQDVSIPLEVTAPPNSRKV